jgi:hypothetical protein
VARGLDLNQTLAMPKLIPTPTRITAAGNKPKLIDEFVGRVNSGDAQVSIAGQGVIVRAGEWVQYSSPAPEGAEYIAVCLPAFSPQTVHRDA